MSLKLLTSSEVQQCITMSQAIDAMESAFIQLANKQAKLPLRTGISIDEENALTLTMPAYLNQDKALGLKVVSIFPNNLNKNKPSITGFIMLLDASTGEPKILMDAGYLTSLRTGAISGLATKYFSRDIPSTVAIVGAGAQAITQLEAVAAVRSIEKVFVWSRNVESARKLVAKMNSSYDIEVCEQLSNALKQADIICTATGSTEPLVYLEDLKPHVHINAIGSHNRLMHEISAEVLQKSVVIVDQLAAATSEAGEIIKAIEEQKLKKQDLIELGTWLLDKKPQVQEQLTVFKSVGLAIQDIGVAQVVYKNALKMNLGTNFKLN